MALWRPHALKERSALKKLDRRQGPQVRCDRTARAARGKAANLFRRINLTLGFERLYSFPSGHEHRTARAVRKRTKPGLVELTVCQDGLQS